MRASQFFQQLSAKALRYLTLALALSLIIPADCLAQQGPAADQSAPAQTVTKPAIELISVHTRRPRFQPGAWDALVVRFMLNEKIAGPDVSRSNLAALHASLESTGFELVGKPKFKQKVGDLWEFVNNPVELEPGEWEISFPVRSSDRLKNGKHVITGALLYQPIGNQPDSATNRIPFHTETQLQKEGEWSSWNLLWAVPLGILAVALIVPLTLVVLPIYSGYCAISHSSSDC